jgi:hypothetical protein
VEDSSGGGVGITGGASMYGREDLSAGGGRFSLLLLGVEETTRATFLKRFPVPESA